VGYVEGWYVAVSDRSQGLGKKLLALEARLQPPFRSKQEVIINLPLEAVWSFSIDLTKIPEAHPRVAKVLVIA